ncbi:Uroporphyrinogen-III methyltransferase / Uroporphyrinogen-III synthase [hydrothermal vent metagenome]|uniref:uroporphyrinogen-III C-methyltransferase n=1 Tax=hydrothermal vent metagenome TaxID=652676 RepID=A0A3B1CMI1_9ZZZZ
MSEGIVYLIGAGPGDPGLITVKGKELIETADVIIYDYLANPKLLDYAKADAQVIYVGKMGGKHTMTQDKINELLVEKCKEGKNIARLKGGDPFIFGRGGEEAEELVNLGLKFEVVPGVTAASAATAYSGIPLTHRDYTSTVAFITGHEDPTKPESSIDWAKISTGIGTIVFYMGIKNLPNIAANLMKNGRAKNTPVAVIRWGSTPEQQTVIGTLETIVELAKKAGIKPPALTVVGEVVALKPTLDWFETKPLFGRKIVVTRAREQASGFATILAESGAHVIEFPTIETVKPDSWDELDKALDILPEYDWIIFTSVNGVKFFVERLKERNGDIRDLKGVKVCAIGPKTAEAIEELGVRVDLLPKEYRAEAIIEGLGSENIDGSRILIPRARVAREVLPDELAKMGAKVTIAQTYVTIKPEEKKESTQKLFEEGKIDAVTFTSSSTVKNFVDMWGEEETKKLLNGVAIASIGPITTGTAIKYGLSPGIEPKDYTTPALAQALIDHFGNG